MYPYATAAQDFALSVQQQFALGTSATQIGVIAFSTSAQVLTTLTTDRPSVEAAIRGFSTGGGTGISPGLEKANELLTNAEACAQQTINDPRVVGSCLYAITLNTASKCPVRRSTQDRACQTPVIDACGPYVCDGKLVCSDYSGSYYCTSPASTAGAPARKRMVVLLTDGVQSSYFGGDQGAITTANQLKAEGITIISVGFGGANSATVAAMASQPASLYSYTGSSIADVQAHLADMCTIVASPQPPPPPPSAPVAPPIGPLSLGVVWRDFSWTSSADFHPTYYDGQTYNLRTGMMKTDLGADNKPVCKTSVTGGGQVLTSCAVFDSTWYHDVPGVNLRVAGTLDLTYVPATGVYEYISANYFPLDGKG